MLRTLRTNRGLTFFFVSFAMSQRQGQGSGIVARAGWAFVATAVFGVMGAA